MIYADARHTPCLSGHGAGGDGFGTNYSTFNSFCPANSHQSSGVEKRSGVFLQHVERQKIPGGDREWEHRARVKARAIHFWMLSKLKERNKEKKQQKQMAVTNNGTVQIQKKNVHPGVVKLVHAKRRRWWGREGNKSGSFFFLVGRSWFWIIHAQLLIVLKQNIKKVLMNSCIKRFITILSWKCEWKFDKTKVMMGKLEAELNPYELGKFVIGFFRRIF